MADFTEKPRSAAHDEPRYAEELVPLIYSELRKLAQMHMSKEFIGGHTLQATALVHEAWLRMAANEDRTWKNRSDFFSAASGAMRRILVEHARSKLCLKRGGKLVRLDIDAIELGNSEKDEIFLQVDEALERLGEVNPLWARIVVLKFFGGLTNKETAETIGISEGSVDRYWAGAKIWLRKQISSRV